MALAGNVVDTMLNAEYQNHSYTAMREAVQHDLGNVTITDTRWRLALAPCAVFLTSYRRATGTLDQSGSTGIGQFMTRTRSTTPTRTPCSRRCS